MCGDRIARNLARQLPVRFAPHAIRHDEQLQFGQHSTSIFVVFANPANVGLGSDF
jgi:hypothetical protein